ncbi:MAG: 6,7-dimethyl-8-ribityllumazine synthase [Acidobacteriota bacterium]|jgi:6,7-dimethyl-8-ribityllumazine synthase
MSDLQQHSDLAADAAAGLRFALVVSRFNEDITAALLDGALESLSALGAAAGDLRVVQVPGAFELPMTAARLADGRVDAIICLGALVRGETPHFEYLSQAVAQGIEQVAVHSGVPVIFGVLTCDSRAHALARAGGDKGNKGAEAALAAVEMALLFAALRREG